MRNKFLVAGTLALAMTCTTVFSSITPAVVKAASVSTVQTQTAENSDDYVYCYAGLTWAEYWKAEGVTAAGDTTSSDTADSHDEYDKGAFDAVTRATANHGLHRGSYQCTAVIEGEKGLFIAMPSRRAGDGEYRDIAHPINSDMRDRLQSEILAKYEEAVKESRENETAEE